MTEVGQRPSNPRVAPIAVLCGHAQHETPDRLHHPGPRRSLPRYLLAINFRCQAGSVSGVTMEATSGSTLVPSFSAFSAGLWQVSAGRGYQPRWSHDGKELFYVEGETLTAVEVTTSPAFATVAATPLFSDP